MFFFFFNYFFTFYFLFLTYLIITLINAMDRNMHADDKDEIRYFFRNVSVHLGPLSGCKN